MRQSRRKFIATIAAAGNVIPFASGFSATLPSPAKINFPLSLFSKPLDNYDFEFICECAKSAGIGGLDLTVRKGGKIDPADVVASLPELIGKAAKYDLSTNMIVTEIVSSNDIYTEKILKTAAGSGVKYYRLGWFDYDKKVGIQETLEKCRKNFKELERLNRKFNIHGGYQNHSGTRVGAPVWDLHELLRNLAPEFLGSQYDVRHAMVEGTYTWPIGMRLIASHIRTLAIKDFTWETTGGITQPVSVPLGEGMIDWDLFFQIVKEFKIIAPITLHIEYPLLEKNEENLPLIQQQDIIIGKLKKDADFIKSYLTKYQLNT